MLAFWIALKKEAGSCEDRAVRRTDTQKMLTEKAVTLLAHTSVLPEVSNRSRQLLFFMGVVQVET